MLSHAEEEKKMLRGCFRVLKLESVCGYARSSKIYRRTEYVWVLFSYFFCLLRQSWHGVPHANNESYRSQVGVFGKSFRNRIRAVKYVFGTSHAPSCAILSHLVLRCACIKFPTTRTRPPNPHCRELNLRRRLPDAMNFNLAKIGISVQCLFWEAIRIRI